MVQSNQTIIDENLFYKARNSRIKLAICKRDYVRATFYSAQQAERFGARALQLVITKRCALNMSMQAN